MDNLQGFTRNKSFLELADRARLKGNPGELLTHLEESELLYFPSG